MSGSRFDEEANQVDLVGLFFCMFFCIFLEFYRVIDYINGVHSVYGVYLCNTQMIIVRYLSENNH